MGGGAGMVAVGVYGAAWSPRAGSMVGGCIWTAMGSVTMDGR